MSCHACMPCRPWGSRGMPCPLVYNTNSIQTTHLHTRITELFIRSDSLRTYRKWPAAAKGYTTQNLVSTLRSPSSCARSPHLYVVQKTVRNVHSLSYLAPTRVQVIITTTHVRTKNRRTRLAVSAVDTYGLGWVALCLVVIMPASFPITFKSERSNPPYLLTDVVLPTRIRATTPRLLRPCCIGRPPPVLPSGNYRKSLCAQYSAPVHISAVHHPTVVGHCCVFVR